MKNFRDCCITILLLINGFGIISARTLHVGSGQIYETLNQVIGILQPGDTVMIHTGIYQGGLVIADLKGEPNKWILFKAAPEAEVVFQGGTNSWQMINVAYIKIEGLTFRQQTGNGFNIDDGGDYTTPTHHIIFEKCIFRDINASGNNDLLKMSGIDDFVIRECVFMNGAAGGSGIDMVGCHDGLIIKCHFENMGSNAIQAKGGCRNIRIERNFFKNGGQRSLNLGGSTGLQFFRPLDAKYEAAELKVYANVFLGSVAPVAFVGCIDSEVINNTFYLPQKWVLRILQETVDTTRFFPCSNNKFINNLIFKDNQVTVDCNIGPNTEPESFIFSNNLWFHSQNSGWTGPSTLPVQDVNSLINVDPMLSDPGIEDFSILPESPAIGYGLHQGSIEFDFAGNRYNIPPSIGAFEGNPVLSASEILTARFFDATVFPNPASGQLNIRIKNFTNPLYFQICDQIGNMVLCGEISESEKMLDISCMTPMLYFIEIRDKKTALSKVKAFVIH